MKKAKALKLLKKSFNNIKGLDKPLKLNLIKSNPKGDASLALQSAAKNAAHLNHLQSHKISLSSSLAKQGEIQPLLRWDWV